MRKAADVSQEGSNRPSLDEFIDAGLYDPGAIKAEQRRELLEHFLNRGFTVEQIVEAAGRASPLTDIGALIARTPPVRVVLAELAAAAGVAVDEMVEVRRALGFPVPADAVAMVPQSFADDFALFQFACSQFGRDATLGFARVLGATVATLMEAGRELFAGSLHGTDATELEIMQANEVAYEAWLALHDVVGHLMREWASRDVWFETSLITGGRLEVAIAFVDLLDSTGWTAGQSPADHIRAVSLFESLASDLAVAEGGRVVKFIGDEAMIVSSDPVATVNIAVRLCQAVAAEPSLPLARGAVGYGQVTARGGDYFGDTVNIVARATKAAGPGTVVVTAELVSYLNASQWTLRDLGPVILRGVTEPIDLWEAIQLDENC